MAIGILQRSRSYLGKSFASLRVRDFRYLTFSSVTLGFGQWFQQIGLGVLVYEMTGSGTQLGLITGLRGAMLLGASPIGGLLADRFSRRIVIILSTAVGALQAVVLAFLILTELAQVWHLYLFSVVEGIATSINQPARQAFVRDVVEQRDLTNAIALSSIANNAARVSGPPLAGVVYGFLGPASVFLTVAALKGIAMVLTLLISRRTRQVVTRSQQSPLRDLWEGIHYSYQDKVVLALLVVGGIPSLLVFPYVQMLPVFAYKVLDSGPEGYGFLASAVGWGSLVGLALMTFAGDVRRKGLVMFATFLLYTMFVAAFAQSRNFALSMTLLIGAGVFFAPSSALIQILLLVKAREAMMGRVMALNGMVHGLMPLGAIPMGVAIDLIGAPNAVSIFVLLAAVSVAVVAVLAPSLRRV